MRSSLQSFSSRFSELMNRANVVLTRLSQILLAAPASLWKGHQGKHTVSAGFGGDSHSPHPAAGHRFQLMFISSPRCCSNIYKATSETQGNICKAHCVLGNRADIEQAHFSSHSSWACTTDLVKRHHSANYDATLVGKKLEREKILVLGQFQMVMKPTTLN